MWAEATNLFALRHPNITYVYDAFKFQGQFFIIVERCSCTLGHLIKTVGVKGELWLPCVAHGLLGAINFIHRRGHVHKDLHPNNIFALMKSRIDPDLPGAMIKVGDMGRCTTERDVRASGPTMMNTWMFPPECLAPAEFGALGRQADIFHAGALLLALLLGRIPRFTDEEILAGKPRELALSVDSPFEGAIANALQSRVDRRTQSAAQFWQDLSRTGYLRIGGLSR
ncbi:MAG: protein kinase [Betaproteobacteria bacterium]|nr:protein kinase [Betaproteobacteria bacterium]